MTTTRELLDERYAAFEAKAPGTDNLGQTGDERDLYAVVDALIASVKAALPSFACVEGCCSCCFVPPLVTGIEWQALHRHLLALPADRLARILEGAEMVRPLLPAMVRWHEAFASGEMSPAVTIQCPFLVGGRCSVYEARPLICRGHGHMSTRSPEGLTRFFGSHLAIAHIEHTFPEGTAHVPSIQPWLERTRAMNRSANGISTWLPLWLWAHLDGDGCTLKPMADLAPDFSLLVTRARSAGETDGSAR